MESKKLSINYLGELISLSYFMRPGNEIPLVYFHGLGCSKSDFAEVLNVNVLKEYTSFGFDLPGCGNSTYPKGVALSMDDLVEVTHRVVSQLNLSPFIVIGHSMGGLVALLYAEKYSNDVKGFINVEGNLSSEDCFVSREVLRHNFEPFTKVFFKDYKKRCIQSNNKGLQACARSLENASEKAFFDYCPSLVSYSDNGKLVERFIGLNLPKLFIYGSENNKLSYLPKLREGGIEVVEIPDSNHWPGYDNPKAYYRSISNFLNQYEFSMKGLFAN